MVFLLGNEVTWIWFSLDLDLPVSQEMTERLCCELLKNVEAEFSPFPVQHLLSLCEPALFTSAYREHTEEHVIQLLLWYLEGF